LDLDPPPYGKLHLYDAMDLSIQTIQLKKNPNCKICGTQPDILTLEDTQFFCELHDQENPSLAEWGWSVQQLHQAVQSGQEIRLIDVRDPVEREVVFLPGSENIPYDNIKAEIITNPDKPVIFYCRNGVRSGRVVQKLRNSGFKNIFNLIGGTNAWVREIDPESYLY
jgi:adenylyltransferase/sulfurtransferase